MDVFVFKAQNVNWGSGIAVVSGKSSKEAYGTLVEYLKATYNGYAIRYFSTDDDCCERVTGVLDYDTISRVIAFNLYEE